MSSVYKTDFVSEVRVGTTLLIEGPFVLLKNKDCGMG